MEAQNLQNIDETAGCFGDIMAEILVCKQDMWEPYLRRIGFYLGKFIYIMDAVDDVEKDIKKGNYNPLKSMYESMTKEEFLASGREILTMMMAEVSDAFEKLPCIQDEDILRNILYAGVWNKLNCLSGKCSLEEQLINEKRKDII